MTFDWETFTYTEDWLREAVQIEVESKCDIQIGGVASNSTVPPIDSARFQTQFNQVRLQSMLFSELRNLVERANLGVGTEAALTQGRQRLRARLPHLTLTQQEYLAVLVAEGTASPEKPVRVQLSQVLRSLLTPEDWQEIARAAMDSIQTHLLEHVS